MEFPAWDVQTGLKSIIDNSENIFETLWKLFYFKKSRSVFEIRVFKQRLISFKLALVFGQYWWAIGLVFDLSYRTAKFQYLSIKNGVAKKITVLCSSVVHMMSNRLNTRCFQPRLHRVQDETSQPIRFKLLEKAVCSSWSHWSVHCNNFIVLRGVFLIISS